MLATMRLPFLFVALTTLGCGATRGDDGPVTSTTPTSQPTVVGGLDAGTIPAGQEIDVRLQTTLSSETTTVEQRFNSTTVVNLIQNGRVLVPAGSVVRGVISAVDEAGRLDRTGSLTLTFDQMVVNGREIPMAANATQVFQSGGITEELDTAGIGAGLGGIVGGVIGGLEGALIGAAIGAGGAIVATEGENVTLPAGSIIRIRLASPVQVW
jgi:hypothetical protein